MRQRRLRILTPSEIKALYERPTFTQDERHEYFLLTAAEEEVLDQLRTTRSKLYFILQLGYFKAKYRFFIFDLADVDEDVAYIQQRYNMRAAQGRLDKQTRLKQQGLILHVCQYRRCNDQYRERMAHHAGQAARLSGKPVYIFRRVWKYLTEQRVIVPGYSVMQNLVGQALVFSNTIK